MSDHIRMDDVVTLAEAAQILGVTPRQAQRLAASGELGPTRKIGRTVVAQSTEVYRAKNSGTISRGRPALPETAWTALHLLSGRPAHTPRDERIISRLSVMTPAHVARFTRRRARIVRFRAASRAAQNDMAAGLIEGGMLPTGLMSPLAAEWGLAGDNSADAIDGYLRIGADDAVRALGLREEREGRISLRIVDKPIEVLPSAAVALDLMESLDSRARAIGQVQLRGMIESLT